jgi:hypothetical protein
MTPRTSYSLEEGLSASIALGLGLDFGGGGGGGGGPWWDLVMCGTV